MGRVKLGQQKETMIHSYHDYEVKEIDLMHEGLSAPAVQIYQGKNLLLTAELDKGVVYRIGASNPKFRTQDGIGVGSTFGDVKLKYGPPVFVTEAFFTEEEGGRVFALFKINSGSVSFGFDVEGGAYPPSPKESSQIREILVVRFPK